jgi:AAA15 family ATPase/GTPase
MLIDFAVENYRSFKERVEFSMVAIEPYEGHLRHTSIIEQEERKLLKCAAIYGDTNSGKSNLIEALKEVIFIIRTNDFSYIRAYKGNEQTSTIFRIRFYANKKIYAYKVRISSETARIIEDYLEIYDVQTGKERYYCRKDGIIIGDPDFQDQEDLSDGKITLISYIDKIDIKTKLKFHVIDGLWFKTAYSNDWLNSSNHSDYLNNVLIVDDISMRIHPLYLRKVIRDTYNSTNKVQLIFTTNDVSLPSSGLLSKEGIWFIEKTALNFSDLTSLCEFDCQFNKNWYENWQEEYLKGRYGAIPHYS